LELSSFLCKEIVVKKIMESSNEVPKRKRGRPLSKTGVISVQSKDPAPSSPSTPEKGQTSQIAKRRGRPPKNCASTPESTSFKGASSTNNDTKRRIRPSVVPVGRETIVSKKGETPSRNRLENFTPVKVDYEIQKRGCKPRSVSVPPPNSKVNQKGNVKVERDLKRSLSRERVPSKLRKIKIPPKSSEFLEDSDDSHESSLIKIDSDQKIFLSRYQPVSRGRNRGSPKNKVDNNNQFDVANDSTKFNRLRKPLQSDIEAFKVKKEREMQNDFSNKNFCGPQRVRPSLESNNKDKFDDVKGSTTLRKLNRSVSRGRQRRSSSESSSNETNLAQNFKKKSGKSQVRNLSVPHDLKRKRSSLKDNEEINHSDRNRSMSRGRPLSKSKAEDGKNKNSDTQDFTTKKKTEKTPLR
ncbi:12752_t:CDS:1, partial [Dentiscutata erythropus]